MKIEFSIPVKPFSINSMYYGDARTKTTAAREWSYQVFHELSTEEILTKLKELREEFDPLKHCYHIKLTAHYPKAEMYTRKGAVSAKTIDTTNWEKPLVDLIFLPKHFEKSTPYGCQNLNIDDKYITSMHSSKQQGENHQIDIELEICDLHGSVVDDVD